MKLRSGLPLSAAVAERPLEAGSEPSHEAAVPL